MRRCAVRISFLIVGVFGLTACTGSQDGTVTGTAAPCVGVAPQVQYAPLPVRITLRHGQLVVASDVIHGRATYSLMAPAGSYPLESDQLSKALHVTLRAGRTIRVDLIPSCKSAQPAGSANEMACGTINTDFYYPTIPATGEHVSLQQATEIEQFLKEASAPGLTEEAGALQTAIDNDDEEQMVAIISSLQTGVCGPLGYPPAT